jgi:hypothetical protein
MTRKSLSRGLVCVLLSFCFSIAAVAGNGNFIAPLSGSDEVPAVETQARGVAIFHYDPDSGELQYRLIVSNIENVLMSHIHLAPKGANGSIVVWLYPSSPPAQLIPGRFQGTLAQGTITDADLTGPLSGSTVADLVQEMENGNTYVNVHTTQHPSGEVRGQIFGDQ